MKEAYAVRRTVPPSAEIEEQIENLLVVGVGENPRESLPELAKLGAHQQNPSDDDRHNDGDEGADDARQQARAPSRPSGSIRLPRRPPWPGEHPDRLWTQVLQSWLET
jgi:hypothetical protein